VQRVRVAPVLLLGERHALLDLEHGAAQVERGVHLDLVTREADVDHVQWAFAHHVTNKTH